MVHSDFVHICRVHLSILKEISSENKKKILTRYTPKSVPVQTFMILRLFLRETEYGSMNGLIAYVKYLKPVWRAMRQSSQPK